jgi:hypothetical protein
MADSDGGWLLAAMGVIWRCPSDLSQQRGVVANRGTTGGIGKAQEICVNGVELGEGW